MTDYSVSLSETMRLTDVPARPAASLPVYEVDLYSTPLHLEVGSAWSQTFTFFDFSTFQPGMLLGYVFSKLTVNSITTYNIQVINRPCVSVNGMPMYGGQVITTTNLADGVNPVAGDYVFLASVAGSVSWQVAQIAVPEDVSQVVGVHMQVRAPGDEPRSGLVLFDITRNTNPVTQGNVVLSPGNATVQYNIPASASITSCRGVMNLEAEYDVNFTYMDGTTKCRQRGGIGILGAVLQPGRHEVCLEETPMGIWEHL